MLRRFFSFITLLVVLLALLAIGLAVNGLRVKPVRVVATPADVTLSVPDALIETFAEALRIRTVSGVAGGPDAAAEFDRWMVFLRQRFPEVYSQLQPEVINKYGLIFTWAGRNTSEPPILFTAHYDVVPANGNDWTHPPFSGAVEDGYIWGRGAMDDKLAVIGLLSAATELLKQGYTPDRTLIFAFGQDEEIGGSAGAEQLTATLRARGVKPLFILDEGMPITRGVLAGLPRAAALIGVAEKGFVNIELSADSPGGHSSTPPANTAVGILSQAITRLETIQMPARLDGPVGAMFDRLTPEMPPLQRIILGNRWLLAPLITWQLGNVPTTNAMIRTTTAATMFEGSEQANVLPTRATATINVRLLPGDDVDSVLAHIKNTVDDNRVSARVLGDPTPASPVSNVDGVGFRIIETTIRETFPNTLVAPALLVATTDAKHYGKLSADVYRFRPVRIGPDDVKRFHGVNERLSVENLHEAVRFFVQLLRNSARV